MRRRYATSYRLFVSVPTAHSGEKVESSVPGKVVRELHIDLPRVRGLEARRDQRFFDYCDEINEIFFSQGVLRRADAPATAEKVAA